MNTMTIESDKEQTLFSPGEVIKGRISWHLETAPTQLKLRLFWYTQGKGTEDINIVQTICYKDAAQYETRDFELQIPPGPYSFSGRLISLIWALELVALPSNEVQRLEIIVAPNGKEVQIGIDEAAAK